jgi:sulfite reductase (NADPH) hemoprotein beta-component
VFVGGGVSGGGARFGTLAAKIPARRVTEAVERIVTLYGEQRAEGESITTFLQRVDAQRVKERLGDLEALAEEEARPQDFVDLGDQAEFALEAMEGECSA